MGLYLRHLPQPTVLTLLVIALFIPESEVEDFGADSGGLGEEGVGGGGGDGHWDLAVVTFVVGVYEVEDRFLHAVKRPLP